MASLADYNQGVLFGAWIDADQDPDSLMSAVTDMLAAAPSVGAEEFAIFDYEGFGPLRLSEYEDLEWVSTVAQGIAEHGPAFAHFATLIEGQDRERLAGFEDAYLGHFDDEEALGDHFVENYDFEQAIEALPPSLIPYVRIDAEGLARDLELEGAIMTSEGDGGLYAFWADW